MRDPEATKMRPSLPFPLPLPPNTPPSFPVPIALVEDDRILREEMLFQLEHAGFAVEAFATAAELYRRLVSQRFAVLVLDIGLEGEDGLSICRYVREHDQAVGIVFVTARSLRFDRLEGLDAGADAYLTKPVDMDELQLILRRLAQRGMAVEPAAAGGGAAGGWCLDDNGTVLLAPGGYRLRLNLNELQLLRELFREPGRVCGPGELLAALGVVPGDGDKHRVEVILSRLRDKVRRDCGLALPVRTLRGTGYVLDAGSGGTLTAPDGPEAT